MVVRVVGWRVEGGEAQHGRPRCSTARQAQAEAVRRRMPWASGQAAWAHGLGSVERLGTRRDGLHATACSRAWRASWSCAVRPASTPSRCHSTASRQWICTACSSMPTARPGSPGVEVRAVGVVRVVGVERSAQTLAALGSGQISALG